MNYDDALRVLRTARSIENGKPIDRNTRLMKRGDNVAVRLHRTDIVTFAPNGNVTLNTGGWTTVTTKDRINNTSPHRVWSERGVWYVTVNGKPHVFADGITISASGEVTGAGEEDADERARKTRARAKLYASSFVNTLYAGGVPQPSTGDCMLCRLKQREVSHIESHLEEKYYVPSLLVNAMEEFGASEMTRNRAWQLMYSGRAIETLEDALAFENRDQRRDEIDAQQMMKVIRKHVLRQLGLPT
jgi:hypothetical protein